MGQLVCRRNAGAAKPLATGRDRLRGCKLITSSPAGNCMTPRALLDRLMALFPDFREYWDDPGNCFRDDDGSFTLHGVFAEFTRFFRERHAALPVDRIAALGAFVSECMVPADDSPLDNAAATCFV